MVFRADINFMRLNFYSRCLVVFLIIPHLGFCQETTEDSLLQIVLENKDSRASFLALKNLGEMTEKTDPQKATMYYLRALKRPFRDAYSKEYVQMYTLLASHLLVLGKSDSSFLLNRQAIKLAKKIDYGDEEAQAYQGIAQNFIKLSQLDSAQVYLVQALKIWKDLGIKTKEANGYVIFGNLFIEESNYKQALEQYIEAEKIYEAVNDESGLVQVLTNIGNIEFILGHYDKALEYTQRCMQILDDPENNLNVAYCHRLNGRIFRKMGDYEKALNEYEQAVKIYNQRGDKRNEAETRQNISNIYYDLQQYKNAIRENEHSLRIGKQIANPSLEAYAYSGLGYSWYELKDFSKAISFFDSSITTANEIKNPYLVMDAYEVIASIYEEQNNFRDALKFQRLYSSVKDSVTEEENRQGTEELEAKYQNAKNQDQIQLLKKDQLMKDISLQQNRTIQWGLTIAVVLLVIIGVLIYNYQRLTNEAKRFKEIERMRIVIARDLHDDLGSTLSSIHIISQLAVEEDHQPSSTKYFKQIADQSTRMMESMSDMIWSIDPDNDSEQKLISKMNEFVAEILEPKGIDYKFEGEESDLATFLDIHKRKNVFLIFKEALNNAVKYSGCSFVDLIILRNDNELLLTIRDNGKGFDLVRVQQGNGLKNMRERAHEINATLELESSDQGTTVKLRMPVT